MNLSYIVPVWSYRKCDGELTQVAQLEIEHSTGSSIDSGLHNLI